METKLATPTKIYSRKISKTELEKDASEIFTETPQKFEPKNAVYLV